MLIAARDINPDDLAVMAEGGVAIQNASISAVILRSGQRHGAWAIAGRLRSVEVLDCYLKSGREGLRAQFPVKNVNELLRRAIFTTSKVLLKVDLDSIEEQEIVSLVRPAVVDWRERIAAREQRMADHLAEHVARRLDEIQELRA